jgi:long-chain acyl-CoA synthetase
VNVIYIRELNMEPLRAYTLGEMINATCNAFPHKPALSMVDEQPLTYADIRFHVQELIGFMQSEGITKGDKVAILSQNMPQWGIAYLAITSMGATVVPILTDFHNNEILQIIKHSGSKMVFVSGNMYDKIGYADFENRPKMVMIESFKPIKTEIPKDSLKDFFEEGKKSFNLLKTKAMQAIGLIKPEVGEDDIAAIIYTSGTTGNSKGVMLTHKNLVYDAYITITHIQRVDEHDRLISILPLSHTYECTIGFIIPMMTGACVYYLDKPPTAKVLVPAMQKIQPTMILSVPLVIEKIFKLQVHPQLTGNMVFRELYKLPPTRKLLHKVAGKKLMKTFGGKIHFFGIGGALLSAEVERFLLEAGFPYAIGYGLTETSPLIAGSSPAKVKFRATGITIPGIEVRIDNPDRKTGEGEIQVRGATVMKGYYRDKERTEQAFTPDGWFKTGDLGILKKNNYLYIKGRIKNVIVGPSGENIYPEEIEAVINEQECVLESMVYESQGKIIARVFLNYEFLERTMGIDKMRSSVVEKEIRSLLDNIRSTVNKNVSAFSAVHKMIEQEEPFEKTPTQKIKRFLYQD